MQKWLHKHPRVLTFLRWSGIILLAVLISSIIIIIAIKYSNPYDLANILIALLGMALAVLGAKFSLLALKHNALERLHDIHGESDHAKAIAYVWKAKLNDGSINPYFYARAFVQSLSSREREELDNARRQVTRFWYRAAQLAESHILNYDDVLKNFGSPAVLEVLEPLEAMKAESLDPDHICKPRLWPPMKLLIEWYKREGNKVKLHGLKPYIPARQAVYNEYRNLWSIISDD